jgi:hypothetical protein
LEAADGTLFQAAKDYVGRSRQDRVNRRGEISEFLFLPKRQSSAKLNAFWTIKTLALCRYYHFLKRADHLTNCFTGAFLRAQQWAQFASNSK